MDRMMREGGGWLAPLFAQKPKLGPAGATGREAKRLAEQRGGAESFLEL